MQASILVVDSNPESLFSIATTLVAQQHQVHTVSCGKDAVHLAENEPLDLLIADSRLSDSTGVDLINRLRSFAAHADLPVVFVSSGQISDVIRRSHQSGSAFHLKKPLDPNLLCEIVEKALWVPHLVKSHVEQKTVPTPHVSFAQNPVASPFDTGSIFPGVPITF